MQTYTENYTSDVIVTQTIDNVLSDDFRCRMETGKYARSLQSISANQTLWLLITLFEFATTKNDDLHAWALADFREPEVPLLLTQHQILMLDYAFSILGGYKTYKTRKFPVQHIEIEDEAVQAAVEWWQDKIMESSIFGMVWNGEMLMNFIGNVDVKKWNHRAQFIIWNTLRVFYGKRGVAMIGGRFHDLLDPNFRPLE